MAQVRISELPVADPIVGDETLAVVQDAETHRTTVDDVLLETNNALAALQAEVSGLMAERPGFAPSFQINGISPATVSSVADDVILTGLLLASVPLFVQYILDPTGDAGFGPVALDVNFDDDNPTLPWPANSFGSGTNLERTITGASTKIGVWNALALPGYDGFVPFSLFIRITPQGGTAVDSPLLQAA